MSKSLRHAIPGGSILAWPLPLLTVLLMGLSGCSLARAAGGDFTMGAVARLSDSDSSLIALQRTLADSAGSFLQGEFSEAVLIPARTTWADMRQGVRDEGDSLAVRVDEMLRSSLTQTVPMALDSSANAFDARIGGLGRAFATEFSLALGEGMSTYLQPAADSLVAGMMRAVVRGVEADLEPAVHALMLGVRDSLAVRISDVDKAVVGTKTASGLRYALYGAGATVLVIGLISALGGWRTKSRAVDALIEAIERGGHEDTRRAVETCARDAGVHTWLAAKMRRHGRGVGAPFDATDHQETRSS